MLCMGDQACLVTGKIETGDFKGAILLASSEDSTADFVAATCTTLQSNHPAAHS